MSADSIYDIQPLPAAAYEPSLYAWLMLAMLALLTLCLYAYLKIQNKKKLAQKTNSEHEVLLLVRSALEKFKEEKCDIEHITFTISNALPFFLHDIQRTKQLEEALSKIHLLRYQPDISKKRILEIVASIQSSLQEHS